MSKPFSYQYPSFVPDVFKTLLILRIKFISRTSACGFHLIIFVYRIAESFRLEKTFKNIEPECSPSTNPSLTHDIKSHIYTSIKYPRDA